MKYPAWKYKKGAEARLFASQEEFELQIEPDDRSKWFESPGEADRGVVNPTVLTESELAEKRLADLKEQIKLKELELATTPDKPAVKK